MDGSVTPITEVLITTLPGGDLPDTGMDTGMVITMAITALTAGATTMDITTASIQAAALGTGPDIRMDITILTITIYTRVEIPE